MRFASTLGFSPLSATKNFLETTRFIRCNDTRRWRFKLFEKYPHYRNLSCNYVPFLNHIKTQKQPLIHKFNKNLFVARYCNTNGTKGDVPKIEPVKKQSVFAKMKQMTKDYWHVLIPVHVITSLGWVALFYATITNGVDIVKIMELLHFNQKYIDMVRNSSAGNWALTYVLYKIFTPLRYTVTIGCTTMAIRRLSKSGIVKPLSFGKQAKVMYKTTESSKTGAHKAATYKVERQTEPPKT
ncbi:Protein FAM210A [Anthophora plagiata]